MFYFNHWPLSLFYRKSLGNFYVIFLPIRKGSGKILCKKNLHVRDLENFYVEKNLYVRDLDFIEVNKYLYVRYLDFCCT